MNTCKDCRFWDWSQNFLNNPIMVMRREDSKEGDTLRMGRCRRRAPNPHFAGSREDDWCGEFEPNSVCEIKEFKEIVFHGKTCKKEPHLGPQHLHDPNDDGPYDVDGLLYCGRCHQAI